MKILQKPFGKFFLFIFLFEVLLLAAAPSAISSAGIDVSFPEFMLLSISFSLITLTIIAVFFRGQSREPDVQTMHTLVSVSLKFLLELVLVLIWFIVLKKTGLSSVLMFFLLYLAFSLFSLVVILKTLKYKSL